MSELAGGLDASVAEKGANFSAGQVARCCRDCAEKGANFPAGQVTRCCRDCAEMARRRPCRSLSQVQLICLARVLLKRTPLVLMDEATASVDLKTDALVQASTHPASKAEPNLRRESDAQDGQYTSVAASAHARLCASALLRYGRDDPSLTCVTRVRRRRSATRYVGRRSSRSPTV